MRMGIEMWTEFWDMHSGGGLKEKPYDYIYIEAPIAEAKVIFYNRFGHSADRVSCTCCGEDYSVSEYLTIEHATAHHRGCKWNSNGCVLETAKNTVAEFEAREDVLFIPANAILPRERVGEVPEQGYVWRD